MSLHHQILESKKKETIFSTRIFNLSPSSFNKILIGSTRWMGNSILHPTSTHLAYFWWTLLHEKQEIHEKMSTSHFFMYFLFLVERGPPKVCRVGTRWMRN